MKLGFACKYIDYRGKQPFASRSVNFSQLSKLSPEQQIDKLVEIAGHNVAALFSMIEHVGKQRPDLRMFRITSDLFPLFTHPKVHHLYERHVNHLVSLVLAMCGKVARRHGVRLSFHPGQFTVLASDKPHVVDNAIEELEYHTWCAVQMGYGQKFQDFKINIHLSGAGGATEFRRNFKRLSPECRRMLTVENDEVSSSVEQCLTLADICPVVLDIHHHWVMTNEYIMPSDARVQQVIDSWRGVRPTMHYSVSRPEFVPSDRLPDQNKLSVARGKLRAHSDYYHNDAVNEWALTFDQFDIMCESKAKNLARTLLLLDKPYSTNHWSK
ncbi:putative UV-damage endonuclease [Erwinia phage pEa_SNUABM_5]|uniref:Putative UV-damage endonuclease n=1 Tax=Erwinia phage pEa_SNUABM_5 TaxID=2797313 RepID=A0A7T8IW08_9CAUD|nr:putative UV-damage endonuclease [Erwinia phage pEa_SNUABM_5]QQO90438.1 putative UV-damage endonuclease [Erwinia phage pEa_SNUABM_5]